MFLSGAVYGGGSYGNPETGYGGNPYPAGYGMNPVSISTSYFFTGQIEF